MHLVLAVLGIECGVVQSQIAMGNDGNFHCTVLRHVNLVPVHDISIIIIHIAKMAGSILADGQFLGVLPGVVRFSIIGV